MNIASLPVCRNLSRNINDNISKNFKYWEFLTSSTALRYGMVLCPNNSHFQNIETLVKNVLQPVRDKFGAVRITSGYRSPELCIRIGSNIYSNHAQGQAADFELYDKNISLIDVVEWIHNNCEYRELIASNLPDGYIHVAYRENGNIRKLMNKTIYSPYTRCTIEDLLTLYKPEQHEEINGNEEI